MRGADPDSFRVFLSSGSSAAGRRASPSNVGPTPSEGEGGLKVKREPGVALTLLIDSCWPDCNANLYAAGMQVLSGGEAALRGWGVMTK